MLSALGSIVTDPFTLFRLNHRPASTLPCQVQTLTSRPSSSCARAVVGRAATTPAERTTARTESLLICQFLESRPLPRSSLMLPLNDSATMRDRPLPILNSILRLELLPS